MKQGDVVGAAHQQHEAERDRNRRQKRNEQQILRGRDWCSQIKETSLQRGRRKASKAK